MARRIEQLNALLQQEIGAVITRDIEFPPGLMMTVVGVRTTGDLKNATVYVSIFPESKRGTVLQILQKHTKHIERVLRGRIPVHHIPALAWSLDTTEEKAGEVEALLDSLKKEG